MSLPLCALQMKKKYNVNHLSFHYIWLLRTHIFSSSRGVLIKSSSCHLKVCLRLSVILSYFHSALVAGYIYMLCIREKKRKSSHWLCPVFLFSFYFVQHVGGWNLRKPKCNIQGFNDSRIFIVRHVHIWMFMVRKSLIHQHSFKISSVPTHILAKLLVILIYQYVCTVCLKKVSWEIVLVLSKELEQFVSIWQTRV